MRLGYAAAALAAVAGLASTRALPPPDLGGVIDAAAEAALKVPTAGISVAVAQGGQPLLTRAYGRANVSRDVPVTPSTIFHIDSISKNVLAAVILRLSEQHRLRLDDPVTKYVPNAPTHGATVTIRQLLNHTSGIYSFTSREDADANEQKVWSHDEVIGLFKDHDPDFQPETSWRYNNSGFYLAGMVVEAVTRRPYADYARDEVFRPLGMTSASLCAVDDVPGLASGHEIVHGALKPTSITWSLPFAAGAVCATASDLVRWQTTLDAGRFLSRQSLALMRSPTRLKNGSSIDYGLGTRIGTVGKHPIFGHTGGGGGFTAILIGVPDARLAVAVLANTDGAHPSAIADAVLREALHPDAVPLLDLDVPDAELAALAGRFDSDEGPIDNFTCGHRLCSRLPGGDEMPLKRQTANVYSAAPGIEVRFDTAHGEPWAFVYRGGLFMDAKRRVPTPAR